MIPLPAATAAPPAEGAPTALMVSVSPAFESVTRPPAPRMTTVVATSSSIVMAVSSATGAKFTVIAGSVGFWSTPSRKPSPSQSTSREQAVPSTGLTPVSAVSTRPSLSSSGSAVLPSPSPSVSICSRGSSGKASVALGVPSPSISGSQASPTALLSRSACEGLASNGQLSVPSFGTPSPSASSSQRSPRPLPLASAWSALAVNGQLSAPFATVSLSRSRAGSMNRVGSSGKSSSPSSQPSLSSSASERTASTLVRVPSV